MCSSERPEPQGRAGQQGRAEQGRAGRAGRGGAGQGRARQGHRGQGRAAEGRAGQGRAGEASPPGHAWGCVSSPQAVRQGASPRQQCYNLYVSSVPQNGRQQPYDTGYILWPLKPIACINNQACSEKSIKCSCAWIPTRHCMHTMSVTNGALRTGDCIRGTTHSESNIGCLQEELCMTVTACLQV